MTLRYAILGLLDQHELHGYRIKSVLEERLGISRPVGFGQIYHTLKELRKRGLVSGRFEIGTRHVGRWVYMITAKGRRAVDTWLRRSPRPPQPIRDEMLIRLLVLEHKDIAVRLQQIAAQEQVYREYLMNIASQRQAFHDTRTSEELLSDLATDAVVLQVEAHLRWLAHCAGILNASRDSDVVKRTNAPQTAPATPAMLRLSRRAVGLACGVLIAVTSALGGQAGAEPLDGLEVVQRAREAVPTTSFGAEFRLDVTTPAWSSRKTGWIYKRKSEGTQDTLIVFQRPPSADGLKLLMQRPSRGELRQWLFLPTGRTRRLPSSQTGNALFGTEFSSDDLEMPTLLLRAVLERQELYEGSETYVIRMSVQGDGDSSHEEVAWVRVSDFIVLRRDIYAGSELARVVRVDRLEDIDGFVTPVAMTITDVGGKALSKVFLRHVSYGTDFTPGMFTLAQLAAQHATPQ